MERGICVMAIAYHSMVMARHGMAQGMSVDSIDQSVSTRERPVLFFCYPSFLAISGFFSLLFLDLLLLVRNIYTTHHTESKTSIEHADPFPFLPLLPFRCE